MAIAETVEQDPGEARGILASLVDGSAADVPLADFLKSAAHAMSNPAAMRAVGVHGATADVDTVLDRFSDAWSELCVETAFSRARGSRNAAEDARGQSVNRSLFRFSTDTDAAAVVDSAALGDTSALLRAKERYVFG